MPTSPVGPSKPVTLPVIAEAIPVLLKQQDRWLVWRYVEETDPETGEVDYDKPPLCARNLSAGSSTNCKTWCSFPKALEAYRRHGLDGIGFALCPQAGQDERLVAVDLDHCRDPTTAKVEPWAAKIVTTLDSYTEVSPSERGLRLFALGRLPPNGRKKGCYENYESGRYVTVTGQHLDGTPATIESRQHQLEAVHRQFWPPLRPTSRPPASGGTAPDLADAEIVERASKAGGGAGAKFRQLWSGDTSGYASASEADLALANYLSFWCGRDPDRIASLFAQSGLFRSKWQRPDYRDRTIGKALEGRTEFYSPGRGTAASHVHGVDRNGTAHREDVEQPPGPRAPAAPVWGDPVTLSDAPDVSPFPLDVLPPVLAHYAREAALALNCPPDYIAVPMLAIAGGAVGNARHLSIKRSHQQWGSLYVAVIGAPGTLKSPALRLLRRPLDGAQVRYRQTWRSEMEAWKEKPTKDPDKRPIMRRCVVGDTTTESLCLLLYENPRGFVMLKDELSGLVAGFNQYKRGGHGRQVYMQLWAGETVIVDRKGDRTGEPLNVGDPFFGIAGCIQPAVVSGLRGECRRGTRPADDGFTDRFLMTYPEEPPATGERWLEVSSAVMDAWEAVVEHLLALDMTIEADGRKRPYFVHLTTEGRQEWQRFTEAHAGEVNEEDFPAHLKGPWAKLCGYCGRLALILRRLRIACRALSTDANGTVTGEDVTGEDVCNAARLVSYFKSHARKVYALMDADPQTWQARRILKCLATNPGLAGQEGGFTRRDLYQHLRGSFASAEALEPPLGVLVDHGYLQEVIPDRDGRPGRNPVRYLVNPRWDPRTLARITRITRYPADGAESVYFGEIVQGSEGEEEAGSAAGERAQSTRFTREPGEEG